MRQAAGTGTLSGDGLGASAGTEHAGHLAEGAVLARFPKSDREEVRVVLNRFRGQLLVDVRAWFPTVGGAWKPGKGISLSAARLPELLQALTVATAALAAGDGRRAPGFTAALEALPPELRA